MIGVTHHLNQYTTLPGFRQPATVRAIILLLNACRAPRNS